jgi:predicted DsbA family dithiol-disulfide isomerase
VTVAKGGAPVVIRHYTDPTCPFAFSAERQRLRLLWLYGEQIDWELHMVVLATSRRDDFPPEQVSAGRRHLQLLYGMPIDWRPVSLGASEPACRAVVAARLHAPDREAALLRRLRVLCFAAYDIEDPAVLDRAASESLIEPEELREWMGDPAVAEALAVDMRASRSPSPASRAQDYKLGGPAEERRYTCPSYELIRVTAPPADWPTANRVDLPGYRPIEAYETAIANLAPELTRRPDPESVEEVLAWAGMPIATAEVAAVCDREVADVRAELARVATFLPVGGDGYWTAAAWPAEAAAPEGLRSVAA